MHDAFDTTCRSFVYDVLFTPITNIGASFEGAEITTFFAPPSRCCAAFSRSVNTPVDSTMYSAPAAPHWIFFGSISFDTTMRRPFTTIASFSAFTVPWNGPCVESCRIMYSM